VAARVDGETVATCEEVAGRELADLSDAVIDRCRPLLAASYLPLDAIGGRIERRADGVVVHLQFDPAVPESVRQAASVRSIDALRGMRDRGSTTDVLVEERVPAIPV